MITNLINLITLSRILTAIIIFVLLIIGNNYSIIFLLFIFAGVSDYLDGFLARKYNTVSSLGEILDPVADKILVTFILFGLSIDLSSYLIGFFGAIIVTREIWVSALRDYNARKNNTDATKVTFLAKIKTTIQLFTITIYLLALASNNMLLIIFGDLFLVISALITVYTGYIYTLNSFLKDN